MYVTIGKLADELSISEKFIMDKIIEGRVKSVHDGEQFLVNKEHIELLLEGINKKLKQLEEEYNEPIPEDYDIKDED